MKTVIEMAREAGWKDLRDYDSEMRHDFFMGNTDSLERFAELVRAAAVRETSSEYRMGWNDGQINEREACVAIAEKQRYALNICLTSYPSQNGTAVEIANAIRARGNT